jgi:hypothetical protein
LQDQQRFEQRQRILAARQRDRDAIAIANHAEAPDGVTHLAQEEFFEFQVLL